MRTTTVGAVGAGMANTAAILHLTQLDTALFMTFGIALMIVGILGVFE